LLTLSLINCVWFAVLAPHYAHTPMSRINVTNDAHLRRQPTNINTNTTTRTYTLEPCGV
jgi:hypothetical protein